MKLPHEKRGEPHKSLQKVVKKIFEKISKKVLTKGERCGRIVKLSARSGGTVIEN